MTGVVFIFVYAVIIAVANEILVRQGIGVLQWIHNKFGLFLLNVLLHAAVFIVLLGVTGSFLLTGIICSVLFYALTSASFFKYAARDEVLYASDFLLFFKVMSVSDKSNFYITKHNIAALLLIIGCLTPAGWISFGFDVTGRLVLSGAGLALALPAVLYIKRCKQDDFTYFTKGFTLGLLSNIFLYFGEKRCEPAKHDHINVSVYEPERTAEVKPNVIVVLSESFWDIEKIHGLRFSETVVPNFRRLYENCTHGSLVVTPFGGGTCNVESEILTGAPIRYFNPSNSFYHRYLTHPVLSLPRIFNQNSYETVALHTFDKNFYNRDKALENMGFGTFKAKEDLIDPAYAGTYIADSELTKMIIQAYEKKSKPMFILGISMENHQPYNKRKYKDNPIQLQNENLNPTLKGIAEAYAHGLHDADHELSVLIQYFERVKEPTDIVFFGDHLGALGPLFALYKKMGFISAEATHSLQDIQNLYSTEFIIWSNYKTQRNTFPDTSSNFLGNILLNHLGVKKPEYYYFIDEVYEKWHCVNRLDLLIGAGGRLYGHAPDEFRSIDEQYRYLSRRLILESR